MLIKIDLASRHKKVCFSWKESCFFFRPFKSRKGRLFVYMIPSKKNHPLLIMKKDFISQKPC